MRPNIIMIISDALRPRDMSLYQTCLREVDKNIKHIAQESWVFENNFTASNASDPSVTSLFSGKIPQNNGFVHQHPYEKKEEISKLKKNVFWLPLYLQRKGYHTISSTPAHLWFKKGFEDFSGRDDSRGIKRILNLSFMKKILLALPKNIYGLGKKMTKIRASPTFHSAKEIIKLSISKIKKLDKSRPFFMFMHLTDTHYPYASVKKTKVGGKNSVNKILEKIRESSQKEYIRKRFYDLSAQSLEEIKITRDNSIKYVDEQIGIFTSFLKKKKLWKNTIFIILSDHGDNFGEHETYFCRGGLYETSIHTPLIIRIPRTEPGRINALTQNIDIAATLLEILGDSTQKIDGKSLLPTVKGQEIRKKIFISDGFCNSRFATRTKTKKIIESKEGKCYICGAFHNTSQKEEYNLKSDPEELKNINKENAK